MNDIAMHYIPKKRVHFEGAGCRAINRMNAIGLQVASLQYTDITLQCTVFQYTLRELCNQSNECNAIKQMNAMGLKLANCYALNDTLHCIVLHTVA